ncbi:DMT family transporter [Parasutterella secunda]|uniref:DMT family transporter n=1 Tax=Parasutterella secunda TaxID=626947 RepID=UPI0025A3BA16|nr:DMT family transporter [Parasutterella secunda]MDM8113543.1 DMT family transporter [Parasutterella secunda]MDM8218877.1 DMT family transporter [Parasutterella secunda]MDM8227276.1 DMT family transporter [Parasutterella secunda]
MPQYLLAMTIFGTIGLFVKFIELPSTVIALSRGALGTLFLLLVLKLLKRRINTAIVKSNFKHLIVAGVALGLNWIFLFEAYRLTSVATATLAYYMAPIILILLSPILLHERIPLGKWICVICALFGMSLISGVWEGSENVALDGITMGLIAACFYASVVINNKFLKGLDPYDSSIVQLAVAAIVLLPYVLFTVDFSVLKPDTTTIGLTLAVGILHTGVAYWLYFSALPKLEAARIAIFSYIDPAIAILLSVFVLMEPMTTAGVIGAVLILGAALASEFVER